MASPQFSTVIVAVADTRRRRILSSLLAFRQMKKQDFPLDLKHTEKEFDYSATMVCLYVRSSRKFVFFSELVSSDLMQGKVASAEATKAVA